MKLLPNVRFEEARLLLWRPIGVMNEAAVNPNHLRPRWPGGELWNTVQSLQRYFGHFHWTKVLYADR